MPEQFANLRELNEATAFAGIDGLTVLTPRERQVLAAVVSGASSKTVGRNLGTSPRTVEAHRARIMDKLGAKNAADLVRIVLEHGVISAPKH